MLHSALLCPAADACFTHSAASPRNHTCPPGAPLVLSAPPAVRLTSRPVKFEVIDVTSKQADAVTDAQWNAYRGMADDSFPEVPPDGESNAACCLLPAALTLQPRTACLILQTCTQRASPHTHALVLLTANVTLSFNFPVVPALLQSSLKLGSCCKRSDAAGRTLRVLPCGAPYVTPRDVFAAAPADPMRANTTCVNVQIVPGLQAGQVVTLELPAGATYNPVAGAATKATAVYLWGLRRFRVPLRDNFQQLRNSSDTMDYDDNGISYRRMSMWLPHGLAADVKVQVRAVDVSFQMTHLCARV